MHRPTIGIVALVLLSIGAGVFVWQSDEIDSGYLGWMSACGKVGVVMAALWLAHPQLARVPRFWLFAAGLLVVLVFIRQPRVLLLAAAAFLLAARLRPWLARPNT